MRLFGKKKEPKMNPDQVLKSMESLRKTIEDIGKRSQMLQNKAANEMKDALVRKKQGDKSGALIALKRKKLYESEIGKLEGARMNLEQQLFAIEGASMNKNIFESLKTGNTVLKQVHGDMKIEDVDLKEKSLREFWIPLLFINRWRLLSSKCKLLIKENFPHDCSKNAL